MRRAVMLVTLGLSLGCKKPKEAPKDDTPPGPAKVGHSVTKLGSGEGGDGGSAKKVATSDGSGGYLTHVPDSGSAAGAGSEEGSQKPNPTNAPQPGGNGAAAYRDDSGRVHGPGGPVFMGRGMSCDDKHDHCMRKDTWFSVGNIVAGKLYRAVPVFELEKKVWTWRGEEDDTVKLYKTKLAGNITLAPGTPIIWFSDETDSRKWADSEYEALTSSRWEAGVVDSMFSKDKVKVKGWNDAVPLDTVRVIIDWKNPETPPK